MSAIQQLRSKREAPLTHVHALEQPRISRLTLLSQRSDTVFLEPMSLLQYFPRPFKPSIQYTEPHRKSQESCVPHKKDTHFSSPGYGKRNQGAWLSTLPLVSVRAMYPYAMGDLGRVLVTVSTKQKSHEMQRASSTCQREPPFTLCPPHPFLCVWGWVGVL